MRVLDAFTRVTGSTVSWLIMAMVMLTFVNVILRYAFGMVFPVLYHIVAWSFAIILTTAAGFALLHDDHVRVDVIYSKLGERGKNLVNILGTTFFLAPFLYISWIKCYPYVKRSWAMREGGQELTGLSAIYILKTFLLVFVVVLAVQGVSVIVKCIRSLVAPTVVTGVDINGDE